MCLNGLVMMVVQNVISEKLSCMVCVYFYICLKSPPQVSLVFYLENFTRGFYHTFCACFAVLDTS
jgi:hypothetical protein